MRRIRHDSLLSSSRGTVDRAPERRTFFRRCGSGGPWPAVRTRAAEPRPRPVVHRHRAIALEAHVLGAPVEVTDHAGARARHPARLRGDGVDRARPLAGPLEVEQRAVRSRPEALGRESAEPARAERLARRRDLDESDQLGQAPRQLAPDGGLVSVAQLAAIDQILGRGEALRDRGRRHQRARARKAGVRQRGHDVVDGCQARAPHVRLMRLDHDAPPVGEAHAGDRAEAGAVEQALGHQGAQPAGDEALQRRRDRRRVAGAEDRALDDRVIPSGQVACNGAREVHRRRDSIP